MIHFTEHRATGVAPGASVSLGSTSLKLASPVLDVHAPGAGVFFQKELDMKRIPSPFY